MAALFPVLPGQETDQASVMAWGCDPDQLSADPYSGAHSAVYTSVAKLVAAGADYKTAYLTLQEFFEKLRTEPERWGKPFAALLGALDAQLELGAAAIGGKDSMSGSFDDMDVPPRWFPSQSHRRTLPASSLLSSRRQVIRFTSSMHRTIRTARRITPRSSSCGTRLQT